MTSETFRIAIRDRSLQQHVNDVNLSKKLIMPEKASEEAGARGGDSMIRLCSFKLTLR